MTPPSTQPGSMPAASSPPSPFKSLKISYFNDALIIHQVDFPIYYIEAISERHVLVAGGGGSAKTGVHNQINILEIVQSGQACSAALVMKYHTPAEVPDAIMSGALMRDLPIVDTRQLTGGSQLTMYTISYSHQKKLFSVTGYETLEHRLPNSEIKTLKYTPGRILTGSMDGQLALWDSSDKKMLAKTKAYEAEIDEIDVDVDAGQIATICRSKAKCSIWRLDNSLKKVHEFDKDFINDGANQPVGSSPTKPSKYAYRSCKYGRDHAQISAKSDDKKSFLYIACNSIPSNGTSKLYRVSSSKLADRPLCKTVRVDGIMAMKVSQDGRYMGIGTRMGSVLVFEAKNLNQIYAINGAHLNAVTNLEFLDPKPETLSLTNSSTCALLSVSIDRRIVLHRPKKASMTRKILESISKAFVICLVVTNLLK